VASVSKIQLIVNNFQVSLDEECVHGGTNLAALGTRISDACKTPQVKSDQVPFFFSPATQNPHAPAGGGMRRK
jgi:hypothetical protein